MTLVITGRHHASRQKPDWDKIIHEMRKVGMLNWLLDARKIPPYQYLTLQEAVTAHLWEIQTRINGYSADLQPVVDMIVNRMKKISCDTGE